VFSRSSLKSNGFVSNSLLQFNLFADDTNLFYCNKSLQLLEQTVNTELDSLSDWFKANTLSLNIDKLI